MFVKVTGDAVVYPYTIGDFYAENANTSFPSDVTSILPEYGVFPVETRPYPTGFDPATQNIAEADPALENGVWVQVWQVTDASPEEIAAHIDAWRHTAVVSPFQGRAALLHDGLLDNVETMMANPETPREIRLAWEYATEWRRMSPMLIALAQQLQLTDAQVDDLIRYAQTVEV